MYRHISSNNQHLVAPKTFRKVDNNTCANEGSTQQKLKILKNTSTPFDKLSNTSGSLISQNKDNSGKKIPNFVKSKEMAKNTANSKPISSTYLSIFLTN